MIIDRFEGDYVVVELEDKIFANIPRIVLPPNIKEGDELIITIDKNKTSNREKQISERLDRLFKDWKYALAIIAGAIFSKWAL